MREEGRTRSSDLSAGAARRSLLSLAALAAFAAASAPLGVARADEPGAPSELPPPPLTLTITPGTGGGPWKLRVENTGDAPVRLAADPRALVLEVTPPEGAAPAAGKAPKKAAAKPGPVRCELPLDARALTDEGRELVVPAKRSFSHSFDPLFYCFGARERAALVASATVKARLGFAPPAAKARGGKGAKAAPPAPPFVAVPVGAAVGRFAPAKELESAPVTLAEAVTAQAGAAAGEAGEAGDSESRGVSVTTGDATDAARGSEISVTVTIANESDRAITTMFRPEMVRFSVSGPGGTVSCGRTRSVSSPIRELYTSLAPKAKTSITMLVTSLCPFDAFDEPGVYRVTPTFDTSAASGRPIGLRTWDATSSAKAPLLLRVRTPKRPRSAGRPALD